MCGTKPGAAVTKLPQGVPLGSVSRGGGGTAPARFWDPQAGEALPLSHSPPRDRSSVQAWYRDPVRAHPSDLVLEP